MMTNLLAMVVTGSQLVTVFLMNLLPACVVCSRISTGTCLLLLLAHDNEVWNVVWQEDTTARKSLVSSVEVSGCTDYVGVIAQNISDPTVHGGSRLCVGCFCCVCVANSV